MKQLLFILHLLLIFNIKSSFTQTIINNPNDLATFLANPTPLDNGSLTIEGGGFTNNISITNITTTLSEIPNNLVITGTNATTIDISSLEIIGGGLYIQDNLSLATLVVSNTLSSIGSDLFIENSPGVVTFSGLTGLTTVGRTFKIQNVGANLFPNFGGLTTVGREISISDNENVGWLNLSSVTGIMPGNFTIYQNEALERLNAPDSLTGVLNLTIERNFRLEELTGLETLNTVENEFRILNSDIDDYPDFSSLETVRRSILISNNTGEATTINLTGIISNNLILDFVISDIDNLTTLTVSDSIRVIGRNFTIRNSPDLSQFNGLDSLTTVGHDFTIENTGIPSLSFTILDSVGRRVLIDENLGLLNINLSAISGNIGNGDAFSGISISDNNILNTFDSPRFLTNINGVLNFSRNPLLSNISTFDSLSTIVQKLQIIDNDEIENLYWLSPLSDITSNSFEIRDNNLLSRCDIFAICSIVLTPNPPPSAQANNNRECCFDIPAIQSDCLNQCCEELETIVINNCNRLIIQSDSGTCFRLIVNEDGSVHGEIVDCPE